MHKLHFHLKTDKCMHGKGPVTALTNVSASFVVQQTTDNLAQRKLSCTQLSYKGQYKKLIVLVKNCTAISRN